MRIFSTILSWVFRIIFAITLILGIAGNWYDLLQTKSLLGLSWQGLLFILFGASSIVVLGQLIYRIHQLEGTSPNIVIRKTENILGSVSNFVTGQNEYPWFLRVHIANDPKSSISGVTVNQIAGHISFYDANNKLCFEPMIGRWAETREIASGAQPIDIDQIPIPPTGRSYILDIGLKYHDENEFYAYNNETPRKPGKGFRDADRRLDIGLYRVELRLRGEKTDKKFYFNLNNPGSGNEVDFNLIKKR